MPDQSPHITLALCTFNGAARLSEQLQSFLDQDHKAWSLWVSDDGSEDDTLDILDAFARDHGARHPVRVVQGPRAGAGQNYLSLLCHPEFPAGPVALSDQDDVWYPDKLGRALSRLAPVAGPAVYGAQSRHVSPDLTPIGASRRAPGPFCFANALVQNVVSGHSAVLNAEGLALLRAAGVRPGIAFHDWWLYLLITGAGGQVVIDDAEVLLYVQHGHNMMGAHRGARATMARMAMVLRSEYRGWVDSNCAALADCAAWLTPEARTLLERYRTAPARRGWSRIALMRELGLRRQSTIGTLCLYLAAGLGRL